MNGYLHVTEIISVLQIGEQRQKTKTTKTICQHSGRICRLNLFVV